MRALLTLPDNQRAALTLREYEGLSYAEIGEMLGLDVGATTALLYRARASFREAYEGVSAQGGPVGCPELAPLISAMLDQELAPDIWSHVEGHLAGCLRCRRELRQLRRVRRLHGLIPLLAPPSGWSSISALRALDSIGAVHAPGLAARASDYGMAVASGAVVAAGSLLSNAAPSLGPLGESVIGRIATIAAIVGLSAAVVLSAPADRPMVAQEVARADQVDPPPSMPEVQASQADGASVAGRASQAPDPSASSATTMALVAVRPARRRERARRCLVTRSWPASAVRALRQVQVPPALQMPRRLRATVRASRQ